MKPEFDIDKIVLYLEKHKGNLEKYWNGIKPDININKISSLLNNEEYSGLNRFDKEIYLKKFIKKKLDEIKQYNITPETYKLLCLWIIKDWGGIYSADDNTTLDLVETFLNSKHNQYNFNRIASTSKVASFFNPQENIIYDSRVAYTLNWIILSENAGTIFFPIPEGRNSKMTAFDLNVLIRLKNIGEYRPNSQNQFNNKRFIKNIDNTLFIDQKQAYYILNQTIKNINQKLWKGNNERQNNLYYTEMLLYIMADKEIYYDIIEKIKMDIKNCHYV